jgi:hypothetical protein
MNVKVSRVYLIFLAGVILLGVFYDQLKRVTGGGVSFVIVALSYVILLRLLAEWLGRR